MERSPLSILASLLVSWTGTVGTVVFENINFTVTLLCGLASLLASLYAIALSRERLRQLEKGDKKNSPRARLDNMSVVFLAVIPTFFIVSCAVLPTKLDRSLYTVQTNLVTSVDSVPVVTAHTNLVPEVSAVSKVLDGVPVVTLVTALVERVTLTTNLVARTNLVAQPELAANPVIETTLRNTGGVLGSFWGLGGVLAALLGGAYHAYAQLRNKRIAGVLIQGIETAREILKTTPQGAQLEQVYKEWLKEDQRNADLLLAVSKLVEQTANTQAARDVAAFITDETKPTQPTP